MAEDKVTINPEMRLSRCPSTPVNVAFVRPINERLDGLVELADEEGARTNRRELLSALILDASESGATLAAAVIRYRKATAREAAVSDDASKVLEFRQHRPGPRTRAGRA
jgi:hypothetical protein